MKKGTGTYLSETFLHALPRSGALFLLFKILPHLIGIHLTIELLVADVAQQLQTVIIITK